MFTTVKVPLMDDQLKYKALLLERDRSSDRSSDIEIQSLSSSSRDRSSEMPSSQPLSRFSQVLVFRFFLSSPLGITGL
jgi:hypothetical protein